MAHTSGAGWTDKKVDLSAPTGYKKVPSEPSHTHPGAVRRTWKPVLSSLSQQATPDKQVGTGVLVPSHWPDQGHLLGTCLWVWKRRVLTRNKIISTKISCWHLLCCCYNVMFSYTVEHCHSLLIVILPTLLVWTGKHWSYGSTDVAGNPLKICWHIGHFPVLQNQNSSP